MTSKSEQLDNAIIIHDTKTIKKLKSYTTNENLLTCIKEQDLECLKIISPEKIDEKILHKAIDMAQSTTGGEGWIIVDYLLYKSSLTSEKYKKIVNSHYRKLLNYKNYELDFFKDLETFSEQDIKTLSKYYKTSPDIESIGTAIIKDQVPKTVNKKCLAYIHSPDQKNIEKIRKQIYQTFIKWSDQVTSMTSQDLRSLFDEYDKLVFQGDLNKFIKENNIKFSFYTKSEIKGETFSTEGICFGPESSQCEYKMTIPLEHFNKVTGKKMVNVAGHMCKDQLECLMRVIEHEMCHLIIFMYCGDIVLADQHGKLFTDMTSKLFKHTDYHHYIF